MTDRKIRRTDVATIDSEEAVTVPV